MSKSVPKKLVPLDQQWRLVRAASYDKKLSKGDVSVLIALCDHLYEKDFCYPAIASIARKTGESVRNVTRCIQRLDRLGYIRRKSGGPSTSNRYHWPHRHPALAMDSGVHTPMDSDVHGVVTAASSKVWTAASTESSSISKPLNETTKEPKSPLARLTFSRWLEKINQEKKKPFPDGHFLFEYIEDIGLPHNFMLIGWLHFRLKFRGAEVKQSDWPNYFIRSIAEDWFQLWKLDPSTNKFTLTNPKGEMAKRIWEADEAAKEEAE